jgi:hypothetical protein
MPKPNTPFQAQVRWTAIYEVFPNLYLQAPRDCACAPLRTSSPTNSHTKLFMLPESLHPVSARRCETRAVATTTGAVRRLFHILLHNIDPTESPYGLDEEEKA